MARRPPRKRRTREHVIADLSINHVERHALLGGFALERRIHDYGIDLVLLTYNTRGEKEPGEVLLQLKAARHLRISEPRLSPKAEGSFTMNNHIAFAQFDAVLKELGIEQTVVPGSHVNYRHAPSDTLLVVRLHKSNETAPWHVMVSARHHLDSGGVIAPEDFEEMPRQVAA